MYQNYNTNHHLAQEGGFAKVVVFSGKVVINAVFSPIFDTFSTQKQDGAVKEDLFTGGDERRKISGKLVESDCRGSFSPLLTSGFEWCGGEWW